MHKVHPVCRSCGEGSLTSILTLGKVPLAGRLLSVDQLHREEPSYPLDLVLCPRCALVQIAQCAPADELTRTYVSFAQPTESYVRHARKLTSQIIASQKLRPTSLVVQVGSGDGYLLAEYQAAGIPVLGFEPAVNTAQTAREKHGVPTWAKFFNRDTAAALEGCGQPSDVIHAHDVLAYVSDPNGFVAGLKVLLKPGGVAVIEVPYVKDMIDNAEFDLIYHEHLSYFSLTSLGHLLARQGLVMHDVERVGMHGGSLRVFAGRTGQSSKRVRQLLDEETAWDVDRTRFYLTFGQRIERLRQELMALLVQLKSEGRRIAIYGASAESSTMLNFLKVGRETVEFAVDRDASTHGRYTPGSHLKIHGPEQLVDAKCDYVLLSSADGAEEILAHEQAYRKRGGRFIIPTPTIKVA